MQFCYSCGAPVVKERLTVKSLVTDALFRFFNLERGFLRTFIDLIVKPDEVVLGYIDGVRKRYITPISYFTLALFLTSIIYVFMSRHVEEIDLNQLFMGQEPTLAQQKIMASVGDFNALYYFVYVPIAAAASFLMFPIRRLNFSERSVIFIYALSQFSVLFFVPALLLIELDPADYLKVSLYTMPVLILMFVYYMLRINRISFWKSILPLALFFLLFVVLFFVASIFLNLLLVVLGYVELKDFITPVEAVSITAAF